MPTYQMVLLLQKMETPALKTVLKRTAGYIFEVGGTLRKMENLGFLNMPYAIVMNGKRHVAAHYFFMDYDTGLDKLEILRDKFQRDLDVIRMKSFLQLESPEEALIEKPKPECTLHLDLLPPPFRPHVIAMQAVQSKAQRRAEKKKFKFNTGLDYRLF